MSQTARPPRVKTSILAYGTTRVSSYRKARVMIFYTVILDMVPDKPTKFYSNPGIDAGMVGPNVYKLPMVENEKLAVDVCRDPSG